MEQINKDTKKKTDKSINKGKSLYTLFYSIFVMIYTIFTIIDLTKQPADANIAVAVLKFSVLFVIVARPIEMAMSSKAFTFIWLNSAFPDLSTKIVAQFPEIVDFELKFNSFIDIPEFLFSIQIIFLFVAALYTGYKTPQEKNGFVQGLKFGLNNYLIGQAVFIIFWGITGIYYGFWDLGFIFTQIFVVWSLGWIDLIIWIIFGTVLVYSGKLIAKNRPSTRKQSRQNLIHALYKPAPRIIIKAPVIATVTPEKLKSTATELKSEKPDVEAKKVETKIPKIVKSFCEFCGERLRPGVQFCPGCGVSFGGIIVSETVVQQSKPITKEVELKAKQEKIEQFAPDASLKTAIPEKTLKLAKKDKFSQEEMIKLENALQKINMHSVTFASILIAISILSGIISAFTGNIYGFLLSILSLPYGIFAVNRDNTIYTHWVYEKNYSSRGIDLIMWGIIGMFCGGSGLLLLAKGIMILLLTLNREEEYPPLTDQQWRARIFQTSNTAADKLIMFASIAALASIGQFTAGGIVWGLLSAFIGLLVFQFYSNYIHPELVAGNIYKMERSLIIAGAIGMLANGGGILILLQGILVSIERQNEQKYIEK